MTSPSLRSRAYRTACRAFSSSFVVVTGCQRSGTTLAFMMVSAHPRVDGWDESEASFSFPSWRRLAANRWRGKATCLKHPMATPYLHWMGDMFPRARILWVVRDPVVTVASMKALRIYEGRNWLEAHARHELSRHATLFPEIQQLDLDALSDIEAGALVWKYKQATSALYRKAGRSLQVVEYERLLSRPEETLRGILDFCGLPWSDAVLQHEKVHDRRVYAGNTDGSQPLDASRARARKGLTDEEARRVRDLCAVDPERDG